MNCHDDSISSSVHCVERARAAVDLSRTMLGFYLVRVLPSKTAIAQVNLTYFPRASDQVTRDWDHAQHVAGQQIVFVTGAIKVSVVHQGVPHRMVVPRAQTIMELKSELEKKFHIPAELIDLAYNGQRLKIDELSLRHYRVPVDAALILHKKCSICVRIGSDSERMCNVIVNDLTTVADLKTILHAKPGVPATLTRLQFPKGSDLDDHQFLWHYGVGEESELYLL